MDIIWLLSGYKMDVNISWSQKRGLGLGQQFTAPLLTQPWLASNWYFSIYVFQSALSSKSASSVHFSVYLQFFSQICKISRFRWKLQTNLHIYILQKVIFVWVFFGIWRCCERIGKTSLAGWNWKPEWIYILPAMEKKFRQFNCLSAKVRN